MTNTESPGSSPPEWTQHVAWPVWEEVGTEGGDLVVTWTRQGTIPWQVPWDEALGYGQALYEYVITQRNHMTGNNNCLVAVLTAWFQEERGESVKSMIFMSTIPRGNSQNDAHYRLSGPNGGHPFWRQSCWRRYLAPVGENKHGQLVHEWKTRYFATHTHAEDNAINIYLTAKESHPNLIWGSNSIVVYGLHARFTRAGPSQVLPCADQTDDPGNRKTPCCQDVLDRMLIEWRYGIGANMPPASRLPELPDHSDSGRDGSGTSGGSGGGGEHPASGYHQRSSEIYGSDISVPSSWLDGAGWSGSAHATARRSLAYKTNKGGVSQPARTTPALPSRNNTQPVAFATRHPESASLTRSLAKLSLGGNKTPAPPR